MIDTKKVLLLLLCTSMLGLSGASEGVAQGKEPKPNVLLILTDDQGWGDVGSHGNKLLETPHLDRLAKGSTELERFYVSPVCAPSRASLLTGRYNLRTGTSWVTHRKEVMRSQEVTIAELLGSHNYRTGYYGKWHNGHQYPTDPIGQGFEQFFGFKEGHLNNYFDTRLTHNFQEVETSGYVPDLLADSAISFIRKKGPFFCYLAFNTPHSPFQVPEAYFKKYKAKGLDDKNAAVYAMVENIDMNVGRILQALRESGKEQETIVIFLSDNGPNGQRYNGGLKGIKASVDEGGVRVPFFIRYPAGGIESGRVRRQFGAHIDILPTIAELTGIKVPDSLQIDGRSLLPIIKGKGIAYPGRAFYTHHVIRELGAIPGAVRTHQYLLTLMPEDTSFYDLLKDPSQEHDLVDRHPELVSEYIRKYREWFGEVTGNGVEPPLVQLGGSPAPLTWLPAPEASLYGQVAFKGGEGWANDWLVNWNDASDSAVWEVVAKRPTQYRISMQLSLEKPLVMALELDGKTYYKKIEGPRQAVQVLNKDRVPRGEVEEMQWPEVVLATVHMPAGVHRLKISPAGEVKGELAIKALKLTKL
ncbi:sulfatase-like hydrolase/transferase [Pontibacter saemangeumensis]|uniref:Sulfatase-like hydrolase/transferase n=1 Tax=Pontibacter saemangeumensis TaxID=1084525 RepID=A0ABP8LMD4_9BACT